MTDKERDALVEQIARTICLHRPMPVCKCAGAGRCKALRDNLLGEYGSYAITAPAVLDAIAPAIRRAALEEAANRMADYPRAAPDATEVQHYDEQIEHSQRIVREMMEGDQK